MIAIPILFLIIIVFSLFAVALLYGDREPEEAFVSPYPLWNDAPVWLMELTDVDTGAHFRRQFSGQLLCGRRAPFVAQDNVFTLTEDSSISRLQCRFSDAGRGLAVENLSRVNMTNCNGMPLDNSRFYIRRGDYLDMGRSRFIVTELRKIS